MHIRCIGPDTHLRLRRDRGPLCFRVVVLDVNDLDPEGTGSCKATALESA